MEKSDVIVALSLRCVNNGKRVMLLSPYHWDASIMEKSGVIVALSLRYVNNGKECDVIVALSLRCVNNGKEWCYCRLITKTRQ